jgi:type III restriction enzyme
MSGFNFEKNLSHQTRAVEAAVSVFEGLDIQKPITTEKQFVNPIIDYETGFGYVTNLKNIQAKNSIKEDVSGKSNTIDIMMETGTGKTYTYAKTIFELNKNFGIFKFVVVVPTLSIKAGTVDFLESDSSREHFKEQYGKTLKLHIVESKKGKKNKKSYMPAAINSFVNAGTFEKNQIQVLIINTGMINSSTMQQNFDRSLFDKYSVPYEAISATNPFLIIDEPHKFAKANTTWVNIQKMNPQYILRYGATFKEYENLIYTLTAVDSFNRNLVKGVIGHITEFDSGKNIIVKLNNTDGKEASFELLENGKKKVFKVIKKDSLEKIHPAMVGLSIENLNKSVVLLSNGLELRKSDKLNPYSYAQTLQETMIEKSIKNHFELEKRYLTREVKIKPLTLFFIDNIEEYRSKEGYLRKTVETYIKAEAKRLLKTEKNDFYKQYLEKTLEDISKTHGGYFSKDNSEKDEAIEKEINEILHDKQSMLDLNNTRRFIFSKWTLREGWDNPNVFQICKLRSSGSDISKLQEVGRGLRLPVNQYNNRVKDEQFFLNYFVDFTESDFVDKLVNEINEKSGAVSIEDIPEKLTDNIIEKICDLYSTTEDELLVLLDNENIINRTNNFKDGGFNYIKKKYPLIFEGVGSSKVRKASDKSKKINVRTEKYSQLKELWERLNEKVVLEYKINNESEFQTIFLDFLKLQSNFSIEGAKERKVRVDIEGDTAVINEEISILSNEITQISTMNYADFLQELAKSLNINMKTIHQSFLDSNIDVNNYLNVSTIRLIKQKFDNYLMYSAIDKFEIGYKKVSNSVHPTKFTDKEGDVKKQINAADVGVMYSDEKVADNYFLSELFYDSELEKDNIKEKINEVIVFTKIPKNSIKIPVAGGKSYSPDFAYVLDYVDGDKKLYFVVETKNTEEESLRDEERQKIKHAERFFDNKLEITFSTQFAMAKMTSLISEIYND